MKLGAERRKVAILATLLAVAGYVFYSNSSSGAPPATPAAPAATTLVSPPAPATTPGPFAAPPNIQRDRRGATASQEYRPSMKRRPEDRIDPMKLDPTIRLDLLARLREVKIEGGDRSLFEFSQPRTPPAPAPVIRPSQLGFIGPKDAPKPQPKVDPPKPPPPPIPLKFYGFIGSPRGAQKRAFFLAGEEILVAAEGETMQNRYKIVRIGVNSVVVEDTQHKHEQTLVLEEPPQSG
ncbi:MAG: hypothetical protein ACRD44_17600 [Bryobacteraceae bacterium]